MPIKTIRQLQASSSGALSRYGYLLAASIIIPLAVFLAAAWSTRNTTWEAARDTALRTAAILDQHARRVFDTAELILSGVDQYTRGMSWDEIQGAEVNAYLRRIAERMPHVVSVWITDRDGHAQAGSELTWNRSISMLDRDFFSVHIDRQVGTYISPAFVSRATGQWSFAVSRRRSTPGEFDGTIHLSLSPDYFSKVFEEAAPPFTNAAILVRSDGKLLGRSPSTGELGQLGPASPLMPFIRAGVPAGVEVASSSVDGKERIFAFRRVGDYPLYVSFGIDMDAVEKSWMRSVAYYALLTSAAAFGLLLASAFAIQRARAEQTAITEISRLTERRIETEQKLLRSEKLQSIGQLTGGLAHDFNNLLAVIVGNLELMRRRIVRDRHVLPLLDRALKGAERGASLTQRLLAFARQQELLPRNVDIKAAIEGMEDLLRRSIGPSIEFNNDFPAQRVVAMVDQNQLELALMNLVVNARDAMPDGGTVTVRVRQEETIKETSDLARGSYVRIAVSDTGVGMDPKTLERATEPFFTTKGVGKGTGLGLSMVQGLAQQSKGAFRIHSTLGQGTTAEIWLPTGDGEAEPVRSSSSPRSVGGNARRILLVDDDELVLSSTAEMLREAGHIAVEARSAREAQQCVGREPFDLVITDHLMPNMTGLQLIDWLKQHNPVLPVILASGHADLPGDMDNVPRRLRKPFSQAELEEAIATASARQP